MGTQEDDGWVNAEDYDGYIPFESKEENEKCCAETAYDLLYD